MLQSPQKLLKIILGSLKPLISLLSGFYLSDKLKLVHLTLQFSQLVIEYLLPVFCIVHFNLTLQVLILLAIKTHFFLLPLYTRQQLIYLLHSVLLKSLVILIQNTLVFLYDIEKFLHLSLFSSLQQSFSHLNKDVVLQLQFFDQQFLCRLFLFLEQEIQPSLHISHLFNLLLNLLNFS